MDQSSLALGISNSRSQIISDFKFGKLRFARAADVDTFRGLRRGDLVRVEGEFVNPESLQLFGIFIIA